MSSVSQACIQNSNHNCATKENLILQGKIFRCPLAVVRTGLWLLLNETECWEIGT